MEERDDALVRVAEAITDDQPVAWEKEKADSPRLSDSLEIMRQLNLMAKAHSESGEHTAEMPALPSASLRAWGNLRIVQSIGAGGFGEVYRAFDPMLHKEVALKLLHGAAVPEPRAEDQFLDEARRLARVHHPNVLVVHGADRRDGRIGIWTELLEGQTLEQMLRQQGPLGPREAAAIGLDLCRALAAIHAAGVVHRDVKTENVMRVRGGRIVLMDLGCGTDMPAGGSHQSASFRGTPITAAPEQLEGRTAGAPTDLFGLGVLLYRLVTNQYPVEAATLAELIRKRTSGESVGLRDRRADLPAEFVQVVERAIDPEPARRFQTAGDMERALIGVMGLSEARNLDSQAGARRRPVWVGRSLVAAALVLVVAGVWLTGRWMEWRQRLAGPTAGTTVRTPAARLTLKASLFRDRGTVSERLESGAKVVPGDDLFLEVEGSDSFYVYVLNEDLAGRTFVLFPAPVFETRNPLAGGSTHQLPGTRGGKRVTWEVTNAGGEERIVVVASRAPLDSLERRIAALPRPELGAPIAYGELAPSSPQELYRSIGGVSESPAPAGSGSSGRLEEIVSRLGTEARPDLAVWLIQLVNPGR